MSVTFLEELPNNYGGRGRAFKPFGFQAMDAWGVLFRYASVVGLALSVFSLVVGVV